jgi:Transposase DDE domain
MIDATNFRAHQHSAGARKKGVTTKPPVAREAGLTTKIHVIVDALGTPLALSLTGGNAHDI